MVTRRTILGQGAALGAATLIGNPAAATVPVGYRVPPEEHPHTRTFMQWPNSRKVYASRYFLTDTQQAIATIANTIVDFEPVVMLAAQDQHAKIRKLVSAKVELWNIPTEDLWCRDSGPLFTLHPTQGLAISNLNFNGWGRKQVHKRDGLIAARVAEHLNIPLFNSGIVGEAGGVDQDGHGTLIAHASSWIISNRNPGSKASVEQKLKQAFGVDRIVWAPGIKRQDITDYHIDSLARFSGHNRILIQLPDTPDMSDQWDRAAVETYDILDAAGFDMTVIPTPLTTRVSDYDFVASYANYYVCNGAVIAAQFGDPTTDKVAAATLRKAYPGREVITLNVDALGQLGGGIHCATQQQPAL